MIYFFFFFKQKTAYEMRISDWSSDVCSSDLKTDDLDFGTLLSGPAGGSVTINPVTNGRSAAGGATLVCNDGRRAVFQGTGGIFLKIGRASCRERVCQYV